MLYVTGDCHGERNYFLNPNSAIDRTLTNGDKLFICGDFGYVMTDSFEERRFLDDLAQRPYLILFVDGNHENFDLLNAYPVETLWGGHVHVIRRDEHGTPKIVHLMRGQIFEIEGKKIFTMGGGYSRDKEMRILNRSWWPQELPTQEEMNAVGPVLDQYDNKVDYILTHTPSKSAMTALGRFIYEDETEFVWFLERLRVHVDYGRWYFGHLHHDKDTWNDQTAVFYQVRNMITNEIIPDM